MQKRLCTTYLDSARIGFMKIDGGFDPFSYRRKIGIDIEYEARPKPSMITFDINLWWRVLWVSVQW